MRALLFVFLVFGLVGCSENSAAPVGGAGSGAGPGAGGGGGGAVDPNSVLAVFTNDVDLDGRRELYAISFNGRILNLAHRIGADLHVSRFVLAPAGGRVAFVVEQGLYVVPVNDDEPVLLTDDAEIEEIAWSPDGTKVAYRAVVAGRQQLFVVNADGTDRRNLTGPDGETLVRIAWTADSERILFHSDKETPNHHMLYSVRCDGTGEVKLSTTAAPSTSFRFAHFSLEGDGVAFRIDADVAGEYELWAGPADGSAAATRLSTGGVAADDWAWSDDGRSLAFRVDGALYAASRAGGDTRLVADGPIAVYTWGPNGRLAFRDTETLFVTDTLSPPVAIALAGFPTEFEWSPDGAQIAYLDGGELFVADASGATASVRVLEPGVETTAFAWGPAPTLAQTSRPSLYYNASYTFERVFGNYSGLSSTDEIGRTDDLAHVSIHFPQNVATLFGSSTVGQVDYATAGAVSSDKPTASWANLGPDAEVALVRGAFALPARARGFAAAADVRFVNPALNPPQYDKHLFVFVDFERALAKTLESIRNLAVPPQCSIGPYEQGVASTTEVGTPGGFAIQQVSESSTTRVTVTYYPDRTNTAVAYDVQQLTALAMTSPVRVYDEPLGEDGTWRANALWEIVDLAGVSGDDARLRVRFTDDQEGWVDANTVNRVFDVPSEG